MQSFRFISTALALSFRSPGLLVIADDLGYGELENRP